MRILSPVFTVLFVLGAGVVCGACLEGPDDAPAGSPVVTIDARSPAPDVTIPTRWPTVSATFDGSLDPHRSTFSSAIVVTARGARAFGDVAWDPVRQRLAFTPAQPLQPGWTYEVVLDVDALVPHGGSVSAPDSPWQFTVALDADDEAPSAAPAPGWSTDIAPVFSARCAGCHDGSTLRAFTRDVLLGTPPLAEPARRYVDTEVPARSYLIEKLLPGYPDRFGTQMPPPWSDEPALTADELGLVWAWVERGAAP